MENKYAKLYKDELEEASLIIYENTGIPQIKNLILVYKYTEQRSKGVQREVLNILIKRGVETK